METYINYSKKFPFLDLIEIVECKGVGHPDSLVSTIAENACRRICLYYQDKYSKIPRFNIDQVEINGGEVEVGFSKNKLITRGLITISGKATSFSSHDIKNINKLAADGAVSVLRNIFGDEILKYFIIKSNVNKYSEFNQDFFENGGLPLSEDTSLGIGFYPYSSVEKLAINISNQLQSLSRQFPIGKDYKLMILRIGKNVDITLGVAFKSGRIKDINEYFHLKEGLRMKLLSLNKNIFTLSINSADCLVSNKAYITATGTAAEHDKGALGRGNGISGLITPGRRSSLEVVYGKNPIYNVSKIHNHLAFYLARKLSGLLKGQVYLEVEILSKIGNPINKPQIVNISTSRKVSATENGKINICLKREFSKLFRMVPETNYAVLNGKIINSTLYESV